MTTIPPTYERRTFGADTRGGYIVRPVFRRQGTGPTVILVHEVGGISARTLAVADTLAAAGYTVALPQILRPFPLGPATLRAGVTIASFCVAGTISALSTNRTGMIVEWLRGLARDESARAGDRPVGVIGMCFSGGFALGAILEPAVGAGVMSQPSLPFAVSSRHEDALGVSPEDLAGIKGRIGMGENLRVMRYALDRLSPAARYERVVATFPACERRTIPTDDPDDHSVLADAVAPDADGDLRLALDETLAFLRAHLGR